MWWNSMNVPSSKMGLLRPQPKALNLTLIWSLDSPEILLKFALNEGNKLRFIRLRASFSYLLGGSSSKLNSTREDFMNSSNLSRKSGREILPLSISRRNFKMEFTMRSKLSQKRLRTAKKMANNVWSKKSKWWDAWIIRISWNFLKCSNLKIHFILFSSFFREVSFMIKLRQNTNSNLNKLNW